jgi:hypothetical protein
LETASQVARPAATEKNGPDILPHRDVNSAAEVGHERREAGLATTRR